MTNKLHIARIKSGSESHDGFSMLKTWEQTSSDPHAPTYRGVATAIAMFSVSELFRKGSYQKLGENNASLSGRRGDWYLGDFEETMCLYLLSRARKM